MAMTEGEANLDANNLDWLIPGCKGTTNGRGRDLLKSSEFLILTLAADPSNTLLSKASKTHTIITPMSTTLFEY